MPPHSLMLIKKTRIIFVFSLLITFFLSILSPIKDQISFNTINSLIFVKLNPFSVQTFFYKKEKEYYIDPINF